MRFTFLLAKHKLIKAGSGSEEKKRAGGIKIAKR